MNGVYQNRFVQKFIILMVEHIGLVYNFRFLFKHSENYDYLLRN